MLFQPYYISYTENGRNITYRYPEMLHHLYIEKCVELMNQGIYFENGYLPA